MLLILQRPYKLIIHTSVSVRHTVVTYKNMLFQPSRYVDNYSVASQSTALRPAIPNPTHTPAAAPAPLLFAPALTTVNMLPTQKEITFHPSLPACGACCILHSCIGITPKMQRQGHGIRHLNIFQPPIPLPQRIYTFAILSAHAALQPIQLKYAIPTSPSHPDVLSAHVLRRFTNNN